MKLKKIAALALAGIMAVSMLAGCKSTGKDDSDKDNTASSVNTAAVIAALSEDNKVDFSANSELQAAADKAAGYVTEGAVTGDLTADQVNQVDSSFVNAVTYPNLPAADAPTTDVKPQTTSVFVVKSDLLGASVDATVKDLVKNIEKQVVSVGSLNVTNLPAESKEYTDNNTKETYKFTFAYTGNIAVTSTTNENGQVTYYAVFNVTRTPTRVAVDK